MLKRVLGYCCPHHGYYQPVKPEAYQCFLCEGPGVPIYEHTREYKCGRCGETYTGFFAPECCGEVAQPFMPRAEVPYLIGAKAFGAFVSPATGRVISTTAQYKDDLKESNCVPYEPGIRQDQERKAAQEQREQAALVDKIVTEAVERADIS